MTTLLRPLMLGAALALAAAPALALEATANGDTATSTRGFDIKIDAYRDSIQKTIDNITFCNAKNMFYAPDHPSADPVTGCHKPPEDPGFDVSKLIMGTYPGNYQRLGYPIIATDEAARLACIEEGNSGLSGYGADQWDSPENNKITGLVNGQWTVMSAKNGNHVTSLTCYKFYFRQ